MKCVFIFESIHRVMKAEKLLKGKGIKISLIPVPREISSDCGVAIEVSEAFEKEARLLLGENKVCILECYDRCPDGRFEKKKESLHELDATHEH
ncbi:MAG: DUF3343 domain-containing protein [Deltaproteobacteria bacterium]|nr:DUF3343 domain-containing protein [Deltaproteobacteria bacterium]